MPSLAQLSGSADYQNVRLITHVVRLRPNANAKWDCAARDYADELEVELKLPERWLKALVQQYAERTKGNLFQAKDVDSNASLWIDISAACCFASLDIRVTVGFPLYITRAELVGPLQHFDTFLKRFLNTGPSMLPVLRAMIEPCIGASTELDSPQTNTVKEEQQLPESCTVKVETAETNAESRRAAEELQRRLALILQPDITAPPQSRTGPPLRNNNSTTAMPLQRPLANPDGDSASRRAVESQVRDTQRTQPYRMPPLSSQVEESQEFLTQLEVENTQPAQRASLPDSYFQSVPLTQMPAPSTQVPAQQRAILYESPPEFLTLAALNQIPLVASTHIYSTKARIVGSIPDIHLVCTKAYQTTPSSSGGADIVTLTDPRVRTLELVLLDGPGPLTEQNSLSVYVPRRDVPSFFGCAHIEQLYTTIAQKSLQFSKLHNYTCPLELVVNHVDGILLWTLKDSSLAKLAANRPV